MTGHRDGRSNIFVENNARTCVAACHRLLLGQRREPIDKPCQIIAMRRLQCLKHGISNEDEKRGIDDIIIYMQLLDLLDPNRRSCDHEATREPGSDPHDDDEPMFRHRACQSHTRGGRRRHYELRSSLQTLWWQVSALQWLLKSDRKSSIVKGRPSHTLKQHDGPERIRILQDLCFSAVIHPAARPLNLVMLYFEVVFCQKVGKVISFVAVP